MEIELQSFRKSLFYIGAGFDWEPLNRFCHLTDTFIYLNICYDKKQVLKRLREDMFFNPLLELVDVKETDYPDGIWPDELFPGLKSQVGRLYSIMGVMEYYQFQRMLRMSRDLDKWVLDVQLRIRSTGKSIRLLYIAEEGLTAYLSISRGGQIAPYILCTIQTGVLERANMLMTGILRKLKSKPDIWVRGYEGDYMEHNPYIIGSVDPLYPVKGCDFIMPWRVIGSYVNGEKEIRSDRWCRAYVTREYHDFLHSFPFPDYGRNGILEGCLKQLGGMCRPGRNLVMATRNTSGMVPRKLDAEIRFWDDYYKCRLRWELCDLRMELCLDHLRKIDAERKFDNIYFLPFGLESEGLLLDTFMKENHHAAMFAIVKNSLDLADIRLAGAPERRQHEEFPDEIFQYAIY